MHIPVLQKEVLEYLNPKPNENFIDCTIGSGGHSKAILEKNGPTGKVLGIEWDQNLYEELLKIKRLIAVNNSYQNLKEIVEKEKFRQVSGILFDLGMSSWHLEKSGRGFSFQKQEPLDMRYSLENPLTAEKILNYWSFEDLEKILREYSEERFAKQIAKNIINFRQVKPIKNTFQLVEIIKQAIPFKHQRGRIHPATKTFQALRIAVNDELNNLQKALPQALDVLKKEGRLAVISFHSLEDRIVKNFFREKAKEGICQLLTKKPIMSSIQEIKNNPRARSARLRVIQKR